MNLRKLLLSPSGRIARTPFMIGVAILLVIYGVQHFIYPTLGKSLWAFYIPMIFFFLNLHIIYCVFGKRLHDLGRTLWPLFGMFALLLTTAIFIGLKFGMLEYFDSVYALMHDVKYQKDPEALRAAIKPLEETYKQNMQAHVSTIALVLAVIPLAFTAWLAMAPSQKTDNRYGPIPS